MQDVWRFVLDFLFIGVADVYVVGVGVGGGSGGSVGVGAGGDIRRKR